MLSVLLYRLLHQLPHTVGERRRVFGSKDRGERIKGPCELRQLGKYDGRVEGLWSGTVL